MRNLIYMAILLLLGACQKEEVFLYDEAKSSIQFNYADAEIVLDYNFAMQYKIVEIDMGWGVQEDRFYYGDSLRRDTIPLVLSVLGLKDENERPFKLKTVLVKGQDSTKIADVEFLPSYSFQANSLKDTIQIVLLRPAERGEYTIGITFDVEGEEAPFALGAEEKSIYRLNISDRYRKPASWDGMAELYLGEYSEEKYAFIVTLRGKPNIVFWECWLYNQDLRDALDAYNTAHPDSPKDFTFPVKTTPPW
ncbi:MAG: DUF4843 domain-containing protein [Odoribacter sp.]